MSRERWVLSWTNLAGILESLVPISRLSCSSLSTKVCEKNLRASALDFPVFVPCVRSNKGHKVKMFI